MEPRQHSPEAVFSQGTPEIPQTTGIEADSNGIPGEVKRTTPENSQERAPSVQEANRQVSGAMPVALPTPIQQTPTATTQTSDDDTPIVAADEDLIEKEWVDKAKKIIAQTADDPFAREQGIKKLQIEYVRKRYGREIGEAQEYHAQT